MDLGKLPVPRRLTIWMMVGQGPTEGWSGGAKALGKLPVLGRPTNLHYSRARAYCTCSWGGWVERRCWVNFQRWGVLLVWLIAGQGPIALAVGAGGRMFGHFFSHPLSPKQQQQGPTALAVDAGGGCLDLFTLVYHFSFLSPSLWKTARYRLKYCLKGPLSTKQPTNQNPCREMQYKQELVLTKISQYLHIVFLPFYSGLLHVIAISG